MRVGSGCACFSCVLGVVVCVVGGCVLGLCVL